MYEERKKRINWAKLFLVVIIVFLLILLALKIISLIKYNNNPTKYYNGELNKLQDSAKSYFNKDNIPTNIGESTVIYLNQFEDKEIKFELTPIKGDTCDLENSFIRATRLETEYQVRSYIKCEKFEDSKIDYVSLDESKEEITTKETKEEITTKIPEISKPKEDVTTTKEVTTKKQETTTKKQTTTAKKTTTTVNNKITIGFNVNGGEQIGSYTINKGSKVKLPTPVRSGYTFVGWYKNNVHYTSDTVFNENIILVAKWSKN